jgi:hypothetical protein
MGNGEKRSGEGRRSTKERRSGIDTRSENEKHLIGEHRTGADRRSSPDRRAGLGNEPQILKSSDRPYPRANHNLPDSHHPDARAGAGSALAASGSVTKFTSNSWLVSVLIKTGPPLWIGVTLIQHPNGAMAQPIAGPYVDSSSVREAALCPGMIVLPNRLCWKMAQSWRACVTLLRTSPSLFPKPNATRRRS